MTKTRLSDEQMGQLAAAIAYAALDEGVDVDTLMAVWSVLGVLMPLAMQVVALQVIEDDLD